ncbi:MAG: DoxX family protein [Bacteroidota bacterium]
MAIMFVVGGALHFVIPEPYLMMMPSLLPFHLELVYISGVAEILLGIGLLFAKYQRLAAYGIVALLIAIFPANIYVALENIQLGGFMSSSLYQWIRLPVQFVLIWWALWCTSPDKTERGNKELKYLVIKKYEKK